MLREEKLTVGAFIAALSEYDSDMPIAIESGGHAPHGSTVFMSTVGFVSGDFLMFKSPRVQKEYYLEDDIPAAERHLYAKTLVINAMATEEDLYKV